VAVYRVGEPARLRDATVPSVRYRLRYADGPHDAETLLVDPRGNRLYVATKGLTGGGLYRAPARLAADRVNVLQRVARVPPVVTDGAFAPGGRGFVLRDYQGAFAYTAPGRRVGAFELPLQVQGESITVSADGRSVLAGSEGPESEIWRVPLPDSVVARVAPTTTTRPPPAAAVGQPAPTGGSTWPSRAAWAAGVAVVLGVWVFARRALRRRTMQRR
jgi:hypothetical protein